MSYDFLQKNSFRLKKYVWKKKILFFSFIMLFFSGCMAKGEENEVAEDADNFKKEDFFSVSENFVVCGNLDELPKEILDVLYHDGIFFDVENGVKKTKLTYEIFDAVDGISKPVQWENFIVHDIDRDGEQELVVALYAGIEEEIDNDWNYVGIFDRQENMTYLYLIEPNEFLSVYEDGVIAGANESYPIFYVLQFNKEEYEKKIIANVTFEEIETDKWDVVWYVKEEKVSEKEYYDFVGKYYEEKGKPWSTCDIEGVQIDKKQQVKKEDEKQQEEFRTLPQEIKDILYNNGIFFDVKNKKEYTKMSYEYFEGNTILKKIGWGQYIVHDIDKDGELEFVVMLKNYNKVLDQVRVFDSQEDRVYSYPFDFRGFLNLYIDGTILGSSGADSNTFYTIKFDKGKCEEMIIADSTSEITEDDEWISVWHVNGKKVSEKEFYEFISKYSEEKEVLWSDREIDDWEYDYYYTILNN